MPRPTKAFRRHKINASLAYKRGDRVEAYKLWQKASDGLKEFQEKKRNKNKPKKEDAPKAEETPNQESPAKEDTPKDEAAE